MTQDKAPEKFVVGETVGFYQMEDLYTVKVTAVSGDTVSIVDIDGFTRVFAYREADGQYVSTDMEDNFDSPDIIFHLKNHAQP